MPCSCSSCRSEALRLGMSTEKCSFCSTELSQNSWYQFIGDKISCETCYKTNYKVCRICGKTHLKTDMAPTEINFRGENISVCKKCADSQFKVCPCCEKLHYKGDLTKHGNEFYCHECFIARFDTCPVCHAIWPKGIVVNKIWAGQAVVCNDCFGWWGPILRYEHTDYLEIFGKNPHLYGIELEAEVGDRVRTKRGGKAQEILDLFPAKFLVVKEDGSVRDTCGFEICTAPADFKYQKKAWAHFFSKRPTNLVSYKTDKCGLHIHCARKELTLLTIGKMLVFVNDAANKPFVECIAGRSANNYCKIQKKKHGDCLRPQGRGRHEDRHEAINLMNRNTVEFRIFKGTLKPQSFFKALEFCDALIHFCMLGNNGISYCKSVPNFIKYVEEHKKDYPHLWAFICAVWLKTSNDWVNKYGFGKNNDEV